MVINYQIILNYHEDVRTSLGLIYGSLWSLSTRSVFYLSYIIKLIYVLILYVIIDLNLEMQKLVVNPSLINYLLNVCEVYFFAKLATV